MTGISRATEAASFTRPNDTTAYAEGDIVANSGTAAQLSWVLPGNGLWLRRIRLQKSGAGVTNASFRLWLHTDSAVSFSNNDNGALSIASTSLAIADVLGAFDIIVDKGLTGAGAVGSATFDAGLYPIVNAPTQNNTCTIYGFLEARGAYTPIAQEVFSIILRGDSV